MVATRAADSRHGVAHHTRSGLDLLHVAAIYGANAAGKSNVLKALGFMQAAVASSHRSWDPDKPVRRDPFLLDTDSAEAPSTWEIEFTLNEVRHQYGFTLNATQVLREWLFVFPQGRRQVWFRRDVEAENVFEFGKHLRGNNRATAALARRNSLFLSAAAANNHPMLSDIYSWFAERFFFTGLIPLDISVSKALMNLEQREDSVLDFLRKADLGIDGMTIEEPLTYAVAEARERSILSLRHSPAGTLLPLSQESRGTQAWFSLAVPLLLAIEQGGILCVDELDASLHPYLALECIALFEDPARNPKNAQLVFSTHDTTLLGNMAGRQGLRRDQVWFVEKDGEGATHLYPLTDFTPRKDENLERGYLQGRYGAVPFIAPATVPETGDG